MIGIGMSALVVIMPLYLRRVLDTSAENTVFVFAPAAIGLVLGLRYAPRIGHAIGEERVATAGLVGFATCVGALGFVEGLRSLLVDEARLPLDRIADVSGVTSLALIVMLVSIPAGFASALVSVAARSLLLARTPPARRGQVVATQALLGNIGALAPTLLAGVAADLFGVKPIAVAIAVILPGVAIAARIAHRPVPAPSVPASA
jgi:MFS family permease